jgi:glycosyltransferase involved in cell wall biosynthesis
VDQILCAAGPVDAVTNQALAYRRLFRRWGWSGQDYAPVTAAGLAPGTIAPLHQLRPGQAERVVIHYSGYAAGLDELAARCPRTLVISHNVTPPRYFWTHDPAEAVRCQLAVDQLARLAVVAGGLAAVSHYNAGQLHELSGRETVVIPILFDRDALAGPADHDGVARQADHDGAPPPVVLFVGRLVPHKRQDLVIRAFARWRHATPGARLVLVGTPLSAEFAASLRRLAEELAPGAVSFQSALSPAELWHRYRDAGAFVCLSEHEGFCIPLLEAFHFGLPVIARDAGAVGEVVADAGVLLSERDGVAVVGELLSIVMSDAELRAELTRRGTERLTAYDFSRSAELVRGAVEEVTVA